MAKRYSVLLEFLENLISHSVFKFEGKIKFVAVTYYRVHHFWLLFISFWQNFKLYNAFKNICSCFLTKFM